ncbi:MAG: hypothetical protein O2983_00175 [Planctomycetota bacterium]|nr:hypothetical protein [Planctomycetota bacterium]
MDKKEEYMTKAESSEAVAHWTARYPKLKKQLESAHELNVAILWGSVLLLGSGAIFGALLAHHNGETMIMIAIPVAAVAVLLPIVITHIFTSVVLRVIPVVCNMEHEAVVTRVELQLQGRDQSGSE